MNIKTTFTAAIAKINEHAPSKETAAIAGVGAAIVAVPLAVFKTYSFFKNRKQALRDEETAVLDRATHRLGINAYYGLANNEEAKSSAAYISATETLSNGELLDMDDVNNLMALKSSKEA